MRLTAPAERCRDALGWEGHRSAGRIWESKYLNANSGRFGIWPSIVIRSFCRRGGGMNGFAPALSCVSAVVNGEDDGYYPYRARPIHSARVFPTVVD